MSKTRPIIEAIIEHLRTSIPWVSVEAFPERPTEYQFIHPVGAILVGYAGSKFTQLEQLGKIAQQRNITLILTIFGSSLHNDDGTLAILDETRLALTGFQPPHCLPCHLIDEKFLNEEAGAWQYQLTVQTETQQVQLCNSQHNPLFHAVRLTSPSQSHESDLITKETS